MNVAACVGSTLIGSKKLSKLYLCLGKLNSTLAVV